MLDNSHIIINSLAQADGLTGGWMDRETDRQMDGQTDTLRKHAYSNI